MRTTITTDAAELDALALDLAARFPNAEQVKVFYSDAIDEDGWGTPVACTVTDEDGREGYGVCDVDAAPATAQADYLAEQVREELEPRRLHRRPRRYVKVHPDDLERILEAAEGYGLAGWGEYDDLETDTELRSKLEAAAAAVARAYDGLETAARFDKGDRQ